MTQGLWLIQLRTEDIEREIQLFEAKVAEYEEDEAAGVLGEREAVFLARARASLMRFKAELRRREADTRPQVTE